MKYLLLILLSLNSYAGSPAIFSGNNVKLLKQNIDLNSQVSILSGTTDPTNVAVSAPAGSLYLNTSNATIYKKNDAGSTTNWTSLATSVGLTSSKQQASWSGYLNNSCAYVTTSTTYADPTTGAAGCAMVERTNRNFGTVSTYGGSGASSKPGFVFTPPWAGRYLIIVTSNVSEVGAGHSAAFQLTDGTTTFAEQGHLLTGNGFYWQLSLIGIYNAATTASTTIKVQAKITASTLELGGGSTGAGAGSSMEFQVVALDVPYSNIRTESARITCGSAGSAVNATAGSGNAWVSVANGASAGLCTLTFTQAFTSEPGCQCTIVGAASTSASGCWPTAATSTTTASIARFRAGAAENGDIYVSCTGGR